MRTATRRRVGAVATVAMAIGGLSAAAAGPAHAEVLYPASYATLGVQFDNSASCTTSGTGDSVQTIGPFTADGEPHTATHGSSLTVTRTGNPADVTTATASVTRTIVIAQAGGQLSSITARDSFTAEANAALGDAATCALHLLSGGSTHIGFDLVRPTYVTVKAKSRGMNSEVVVAPGGASSSIGASGAMVATVSGGKRGNGLAYGLLPPGFYGALIMNRGSLGAHGRASGEVTIEITFDEPGAATSKAAGQGRKYASLPEVNNCTNRTAVVTWTKKAGKKKSPMVKKAVFKVDGLKVGRARGKKATNGKTTTLKNLPARGPFTIEGVITLRSGKKVAVERAYRACS